MSTTFEDARRVRARGLALVGLGLVFFAGSLWWATGDFDPVGGMLSAAMPAGGAGFAAGAGISALMWGPMGRGSGIAGVLVGSAVAFVTALLLWPDGLGDPVAGAIMAVLALGSGFTGAILGAVALLAVAPRDQVDAEGATSG